MPGRDGRGPLGLGPMTGRRMGSCLKSKTLRRVAGIGAGLGLGLACRRGLRRRAAGVAEIYNDDNPKTEKELLLEQKTLLEQEIEVINEQLENLE
ncbi:MAG: DUF5320 domain-containing protein [Erysipelotrichaceae bacterium]|jgi:hypothetical protein